MTSDSHADTLRYQAMAGGRSIVDLILRIENLSQCRAWEKKIVPPPSNKHNGRSLQAGRGKSEKIVVERNRDSLAYCTALDGQIL